MILSKPRWETNIKWKFVLKLEYCIERIGEIILLGDAKKKK